jgi:hypothetical protein
VSGVTRITAPITVRCRSLQHAVDVEEILSRLWDNLAGRSSGPLNFRLILQPTVASYLAIRAGLSDARNGRPPFLWAAITNRIARGELFADGWKDVGKVFSFAAVLDAVYQLVEQHGVYLLELLIVSTFLGVVPYVLVRGPTARVARWLGADGRDPKHERTDRTTRLGG